VSDLLFTTLVAAVMLVGLAGVLVPVLPGLALIWAAALVYGLEVGFGPGGVLVMVVLTILVGVGALLGVVLPKRAAAESGASGRTQLVGFVGAVIGFFAIPVVGVVVGALIGVLLAEYADKGNWPDARSATIGVAKGFGLSTLAQLAIGFTMIAVWTVWAATIVL